MQLLPTEVYPMLITHLSTQLAMLWSEIPDTITLEEIIQSETWHYYFQDSCFLKDNNNIWHIIIKYLNLSFHIILPNLSRAYENRSQTSIVILVQNVTTLFNFDKFDLRFASCSYWTFDHSYHPYFTYFSLYTHSFHSRIGDITMDSLYVTQHIERTNWVRGSK